ncbi:MAG: helicase [Nannocystaceae bacterium]|nr:helicase [Nannocystaceae bacterium]
MAPPPFELESEAPGGVGARVGYGITALLGPTNTGKTYRAIERMLEHSSGMIGLPLRLLAREVYDRVSSRVGENAVALVTGEEKRVPPNPRYWVCTVESMPIDQEVDFVAVDEIQLAAHRQRGHTFTDRLLRYRGMRETWFMGSDTMRPLMESLVPTASIEQHPRYSNLSYTGVHSLGSLPPRTVVVAFSAEDVYALAERLRQQHGGTAVVLGALSPRTRNAQVAMYQAGEVQHLVATDAIGMGLNMDVDRVVFASLRKFDGREARALDIAEMAQIAGRAGRYTTDGGFGLLRPLDALPPRMVTAIEGHHFAAVRRVVWRNADLEFTSLDALIESLRLRPKRSALRIVEQADDFDALLRLSRLDSVRERARGVDGVALLWDVCRIPDFRKLLLDSHVELLAAIYEQLSGPGGRIDDDWMAKRITRLDDQDGDIQTLMMRIAFIRTWTYVANHSAWVNDAEHWQQRTREIEDRCSDALHERLTERFVDGHTEDFVGSQGERRPVRTKTPVDRRPRVENGPFAGLAEFEDSLPNAAGHAATGDERSREDWVQSVVDADFDGFALAADGNLRFGGEVIARLRPGTELLLPEVVVTLDELGAGAKAQIQRRAQAWVRDATAMIAASLASLSEDEEAEARGLAYQLHRGLGFVTAAQAREQLQSLSAEAMAALRTAGVILGRRVLYVPDDLGARGVAWRAALWCAYYQPCIRPLPPVDGAVSIEPQAEVDPDFYLRIGYPVIAGRAIRADQLERATARLVELGPGPWPLPDELGSWLGVRRHRYESIVEALGFRGGPDGWGPVSRRRGKKPGQDRGGERSGGPRRRSRSRRGGRGPSGGPGGAD